MVPVKGLVHWATRSFAGAQDDKRGILHYKRGQICATERTAMFELLFMTTNEYTTGALLLQGRVPGLFPHLPDFALISSRCDMLHASHRMVGVVHQKRETHEVPL